VKSPIRFRILCLFRQEHNDEPLIKIQVGSHTAADEVSTHDS
jgi:hypothetical protein